MKLFAIRRQWLLDFATVAIVYFLLAYVALPALWRHHEHEPGLASLPMVTRTGTGIPGDPLNAGLVGSRDDILRAMDAAGWFPAARYGPFDRSPRRHVGLPSSSLDSAWP